MRCVLEDWLPERGGCGDVPRPERQLESQRAAGDMSALEINRAAAAEAGQSAGVTGILR